MLLYARNHGQGVKGFLKKICMWSVWVCVHAWDSPLMSFLGHFSLFLRCSLSLSLSLSSSLGWLANSPHVHLPSYDITSLLPNAQIFYTDSGDQTKVPVLERPWLRKSGERYLNSIHLSVSEKQRWVKGWGIDYCAQGRAHRVWWICSLLLGKQLARLASGDGAGCESAGLRHMTLRRQPLV